MSESLPDPDDNPMLHPGGCPCPRCAFEPEPPAPPLDLDAFDGFTSGPWDVTVNDGSPDARRPDLIIRKGGTSCIACTIAIRGQDHAADAALIAAAPALLAECRRQRERIAVLRASLAETLRALETHLDDETNAHGLKHRDILCPCNGEEVKRARAALRAD